MKKWLPLLLYPLAVGASAASLYGSTLRYTYEVGMPGQIYMGQNFNVTVGDQVEVQNVTGEFSRIASLDIQDDELVINMAGAYGNFYSTPFNGFRLTDLTNSLADITSFSLTSNSGVRGTPQVGFTANSIWVNWSSLGFNPTGQLRFSIGTAAPVSPVPLPGAASLMLGGLGLLASMRRNRVKQKSP
jgi:hypothetical protein